MPRETPSRAESLTINIHRHRLWVVQEVMNARSLVVCCGATKMSWTTLTKALYFLHDHGVVLQNHLVNDHPEYLISSKRFSPYEYVLTSQGPWRLLAIESTITAEDASLLDALKLCRPRLASDPKDKLYGILGILPGHVQQHFRADYAMSVKEVYSEIVDYIIKVSGSLNVICEAIRYPAASNEAGLPSFVPDWSKSSSCHESMTELGKGSFHASLTTRPQCRFLDGRLSLLEISAIYIDRITADGEICADRPVGRLAAASTFLHWRSILLGAAERLPRRKRHLLEVEFAQTLCLGKPSNSWRDDPEEWLRVIYMVSADFTRRLLPYTMLDDELLNYPKPKAQLSDDDMDGIFQEFIKKFMIGHTICLTQDGYIGIGTGALLYDDIVVVPLGCDTPILLRPYGTKGEYLFIGSVYIHGYMYGKAVRELDSGRRKLTKFVLR